MPNFSLLRHITHISNIEELPPSRPRFTFSEANTSSMCNTSGLDVLTPQSYLAHVVSCAYRSGYQVGRIDFSACSCRNLTLRNSSLVLHIKPRMNVSKTDLDFWNLSDQLAAELSKRFSRVLSTLSYQIFQTFDIWSRLAPWCVFRPLQSVHRDLILLEQMTGFLFLHLY